jgi:hypothetical protein
VALGVAGAGAGRAPQEQERAAPQPARTAEPAPRRERAPQPAPEKKAESRLDEVLRAWARAADARRSVAYQFTLTELDRILKRQKVSRGQAFVQTPDRLRVEVLDKGRLNFIVVLTGKAIHLFDFQQKTERIFSRSRDPFLGAATKPRDILNVLFGGLPVRDLPAFGVRLVKEDQWYAYLELRPRTPGERAEWKQMRIVLLKDGWWLRQVWLRQPNDNEMTFDFERARVVDNPPITPEAVRRRLPPGWKRTRVPAAP